MNFLNGLCVMTGSKFREANFLVYTDVEADI
jgi:hypothetical protein